MEQYTGTREMAASHAFDVAALEAWLARHVEGFAGPLAVQQFKGGQSNPTYQLITPARSYVMRSKPGPVARLLPSAHAIEREYRVMKALAGSGVPVARMEALCEDESVIGRAFFIMEHVDGRVMWNQALPELGRDERAAIYDEMNRVIATLHSVSPAAVGLADFGKPGNYFERQIGRWSKQYVASQTQPIAEMDRLIEWLPAHMPAGARDDTEVAVVHGDYRLDNLIFRNDAPRIAAVLDWELSTLGHPLADFSYHCMSWHIPPGVFRGIGGLDLAALSIPDEREYVRRYCERVAELTGRRRDAAALLADWDFYLAYNLFRLGAITQGIAKRVVDGTASSAQARATGDATRALAEMGWHFAQRAGA
jgi:aminoglycoside phosphotransferase (APT) family kinase protein